MSKYNWSHGISLTEIVDFASGQEVSAKDILDLIKHINKGLTDLAEIPIRNSLDKAAEDGVIIKTPNGNYKSKIVELSDHTKL
ncbi:hypothetical protein CN272_02480 [Bacillus anthracis]|uniref:hypothetical protein n=1 Tax=Bacillus tropicus TaxID=2026188 RepID=UPI000BFA510A|nr:hypothetical protein CN272_02480 [Bacillus anthracis]